MITFKHTFRKALRILAVFGALICLIHCAEPQNIKENKTGSETKKSSSLNDPRPNIVLLIIDTLRADKFTSYGFSGYCSPEFDEMAKGGIQFNHVVAQCSWTRPSIASMLTSLYPRTVGITKEKYQILNDRFLTLAEILNDNGYRTVGITANPHINKAYNFHQGFDVYFDSNVVWSGMKPEFVKKDKIKYSEERSLQTAPEMYEILLEEFESKKREVPHYVQINAMEVHEMAHAVRNEFKKMYADYHLFDRSYYQALRQLTHDTGVFFRKLIELEGWRNTLFIITSDHGQGLRDHPHVEKSMYHGFLLYESQLMVPLIMFNPSDDGEPRIIDQPIRLLDMTPTILECAGVEPPSGLQGHSMFPLIEGRKLDVKLPEYFIAETNFRGHDKIGVYSEEWKYFINNDDQKGLNDRELQRMHHIEDGRRTDLAAKNPETVKKMHAYLKKWESENLPADPTIPSESMLSDMEISQLTALGYLQ